MRKTIFHIVFSLVPVLAIGQFRIVGTGLFTKVNDSTYTASVQFRPDLTGNAYNPTKMVSDSMYVLSQRGQLYVLDTFWNATLSSANITIVEHQGNWGSPIGQVMVFRNNSSVAAPQAVYSANGATAPMQAGVDTWNSLLLKVVSDSAVYWNEAYSKSIDSISVSGDSLKTISLYQTNGDTLTTSFVDGGGGGGSITMPLDSVAFNTSYVSGFPTGTMAYDADNETVSVGIDGGVIYQLGQELFYPVVINKSDSLIKNGQLVMVDTATLVQGDHVRVVQARNGANYPSNYIMGVATTDIPDDSTGLVTFFGYVREVKHDDIAQSGDTLIPGNILYPSPIQPGRYTNTPPSTPAHKSTIALVVRKPSPNNMTLLVRPWLAPKLEDASDVDTAGITQNSVLRYDTASGYWKASTTAGIVAGDTSVFARDFQVSGSTWYLPRFKNSNSLENSVLYQSGEKILMGTTSGNVLKTNLEVHSATSSDPFMQTSVDVYMGNNTFADYTPYLQLYRNKGTTVGSVTKVNQGDWLGRLTFQGADGAKYVRGAQIYAITDATTGLDSMPTAMRFATNPGNTSIPTDRMSITSAGRVGIGTTTPATELDVNGTLSFNNIQTMGTATASSKQYINLYPNPATEANTVNLSTSASTATLKISGGVNQPGGQIELIGGGAASNAGEVVLRSGVTTSTTPAPERMRIKSDGKIGIGTATPDSTLHVSGDAKITGGASFVNGDVSIGPKLANTAFSVYRTYAGTTINPIRSVIQAYVPNNSINAYNLFKGVGGNTFSGGVIYGLNLEFINTNGGAYGVYSQGESQNYFSGKVGIAQTAPTRSLHISSTDALKLPAGTTAERPSVGITGDLRMNTSPAADSLEYYNGASWVTVQDKLQNPVTGTGTANRLAKFTGTSSLGDSPIVLTGDTLITFGTAAPGLVTINTKDFPNTPTDMPYTKFKLNNGYGVSGIYMGDPTGPLSASGMAIQLTAWDGSSTPPSYLDYYSARLRMSGTGDFYIDNSTASANGNGSMTTRFSIMNDGKVGIGTTSPNAPLTVIGASSFGGLSAISGRFSDNANSSLYISHSSISGPVYSANITSSDDLTFGQTVTGGTTEYMRIKATTGRVGIGTTSPTEELTVQGTVLSQTSVSASEQVDGIRATKDYTTGNNWIATQQGTQGWRLGLVGGTLDATNPYDFVFYHGSSTPTASSPGTERFRFTTTGRLGIGTASPSRSLHINATDAVRIPVGTAAQRGTGANGDVRFNSDSTVLEFYDGTGWRKPIVTNRGDGKGVANSFLKFDAAGFADTSAVIRQVGDKIAIDTSATDSTLTVAGSAKIAEGIAAKHFRPLVSGARARPNIGMWSNAANVLNFSTRDTSRLQINSTGVVSITTAVTGPYTPTNSLTMNRGIAAGNYLFMTGDSLANSAPQITVLNQDVGQSGGYVVFQKRRGASGVVQNGDELGTFSWGARRSVNAAIYASAGFRAAVNGTVTSDFVPVDFTIFTSPNTDGAPNYVPVKTDRLTVKPDGKVGIGTASPNNLLHVAGTSYMTGLAIDYTSAFDANTIFQMPNTSTKAAKGYAWNTYSDARIKTSVSDIENALEKTMALRPVRYLQSDSYVEDGQIKLGNTGRSTIGFIAQEVESIIPEAVQRGSDTELWGMDYAKLIPMLTKAIQEQQAQIEALKKEIEQLKNK